jgi:hypothetical protein
MKLDIDGLAVEVTRRCNMHCAHCMRGEAKNKDLDLDRFTSFLKDVRSINSITFTGGEPTLNVDAINHILHVCKALSIPVYYFYIVTNGKEVTSKFLNAMIEWYAYCIECGGEPEMCGLALSQDEFHDDIDRENIAKLKAFAFFRAEDKKISNRKETSLLNLGRARSLVSNSRRDPMRYLPEVELHGDTIYVTDTEITFTVNGEILLDCDYEYESTDDIKACDWNNAVEIFTRKATDPNYTFSIA